MPLIRTCVSAFALTVFSSSVTSMELETFDPVEPRANEATVTINASAHPIRLPLISLAGATFIGSEGEIINYDESKGLYVTVVTPTHWGNPEFQMNRAPGYIFNRHYEDVDDPALVQELKGLSQLTLEPGTDRKVGVMELGEVTAFIAFEPAKSTVMLSSEDLPDLFTHISLDGFTWEELTEEILRGVRVPDPANESVE